MDVTNITLPADHYDLAIDKSTIDALLCGDNALLMVARMMKEVQRVLKTGGVYFAISYGDPESRMDNFDWPHLHLDTSHIVVGDDQESVHYGYLAIKNIGADEICDENWDMVEKHLTEIYTDDEEADQQERKPEVEAEESQHNSWYEDQEEENATKAHIAKTALDTAMSAVADQEEQKSANTEKAPADTETTEAKPAEKELNAAGIDKYFEDYQQEGEKKGKEISQTAVDESDTQAEEDRRS